MAGEKRHSQDKIETKYSNSVTEFCLFGLTFSVDLNNMSKLNFDPLIEKINKILSQAFSNNSRQNYCFENSYVGQLHSLIYYFTFSSRNFGIVNLKRLVIRL